jgi:hypothetical protein
MNKEYTSINNTLSKFFFNPLYAWAIVVQYSISEEMRDLFRNDVINYCNKGTQGSDSSKRYGHTQIFTAGIQNKGNNVRWTSSVPANYGTSLVYRTEGPWETYVFRAPV